MKTSKILIVFIAFLLINSCSQLPNYVKKASELPTSVYGSYLEIKCVKLKQLNKKYIELSKNKAEFIATQIHSSPIELNGELISSNEESLFLLTDNLMYDINNTTTINPDQVVQVFYKDIVKFRVYYANNDDVSGTGLTMFLPFTHGFFALITFPINLIANLVISSNSYNYTDMEINYNNLKYFSRFPQGLPEGIVLDSLK